MALMASQGRLFRVFITSTLMGNKITFVGKKDNFFGYNKTTFAGIYSQRYKNRFIVRQILVLFLNFINILNDKNI